MDKRTYVYVGIKDNFGIPGKEIRMYVQTFRQREIVQIKRFNLGLSTFNGTYVLTKLINKNGFVKPINNFKYSMYVRTQSGKIKASICEANEIF